MDVRMLFGTSGTESPVIRRLECIYFSTTLYHCIILKYLHNGRTMDPSISNITANKSSCQHQESCLHGNITEAHGNKIHRFPSLSLSHPKLECPPAEPILANIENIVITRIKNNENAFSAKSNLHTNSRFKLTSKTWTSTQEASG